MAQAALTVSEVVALSGLDEVKVRKDVEHGLFGSTTPPQFDFAALIYFRVLAELGLQTAVDDRRKLHALIVEALRSAHTPAMIMLSPVLELRLGQVAEQITDTWKRFETWKQKLVTDPGVLGGEPVFPDTRLAVRHIGGLAAQGALEEIREDYPALTEDDIEFARLYALAYPKRGRPRRRRES